MDVATKLNYELVNSIKDHYFFGKIQKTSNKYFIFDRIIDEDNFILITSNVRYFWNKETFVLIVDNDKVVYLKDWQVIPVRNWREGVEGFAVKLNRKYFKVYKYSFEFDDVYFEKEDTFDDLFEIAKEQHEKQMSISINKKWRS